MQLFGYVLRKPWVKYVDLPLEEDVYFQIAQSISKTVTANMVIEMLDKDLCDEECEVMTYLQGVAKDGERR